MENKYSPDTIIKDVQERNPDMPKVEKKPVSLPGLSTTVAPSDNTKPATQIVVDDPNKKLLQTEEQKFAYSQSAKYKIDQVYGNHLSEETKTRIAKNLAESTPDAIAARKAFQNMPYASPAALKQNVLNSILAIDANPYKSEIQKIEADESYNFFKEKAAKINQASQIFKLAEEQSKQGLLSEEDIIALQQVSSQINQIQQDEKFLKGEQLSAKYNESVNALNGIDAEFKAWATSDPAMKKRTLALQDYQERMKTEGPDNEVLRKTAIFMESAIKMGALDIIPGLLQKVGLDEEAVSFQESMDNAAVRNFGDPKEFTFVDKVAEGFGGAVGMAMLGKGLANATGKVLAASQIGLEAGQIAAISEKAGTFLSGYAPTYYQNYTSEILKGSSPEEASDIANIRSSITALTELISPNLELLAGTKTSAGKAFSKLIKFLETSEVEEILATGGEKLGKATLNYLKKQVPEMLAETTEEFMDIGGQLYVDSITEAGFDINQKADDVMKEMGETALITPIITMLLGAKSSINNGLGKNFTAFDSEQALNRAMVGSTYSEKSFDLSLNAIENARKAGKFSDRKAEELTNRLTAYYEAVQSSELSEKSKNSLVQIALNGTEAQLKKVNELLFNVAANEGQEKEAASKLLEASLINEAAKAKVEEKKNTLRSVFFQENKEPVKEAIQDFKPASEEVSKLFDQAKLDLSKEADPAKSSAEEMVVPKIKEAIADLDKQIEAKESMITAMESAFPTEITPENEALLQSEKQQLGAIQQQKAKYQADLIEAEKVAKAKTEERKLADQKALETKAKIEAQEAKDKEAKEKANPTQKPTGSLEEKVASEPKEYKKDFTKKGKQGTVSVVTLEDGRKKGEILDQTGTPVGDPEYLDAEVARKTTNESFANSLIGIEEIPDPEPVEQRAKQPETIPGQKEQVAPKTNKEKAAAEGKTFANQIISKGQFKNRAEANKAIEIEKRTRSSKGAFLDSQFNRGVQEALDDMFPPTGFKSRKRQALSSKKRGKAKAEIKSNPDESMSEFFGRAMENPAFAEAIEKADREQLEKQEAEDRALTGLDVVFGRLREAVEKSNPLGYASNNDPKDKTQKQMREYRASIDNMLSQLRPFVLQQWLSLSKSLKTMESAPLQEKLQFVRSVRDMMYAELAQLVEKKHNIKVKPASEIPNANESARFQAFQMTISENMSTEELTQAIQLHLMEIANELTEYNAETNQLEAYEQIQIQARNAIKNKKAFVKKSLAILNRVKNRLLNINAVEQIEEDQEQEPQLEDVFTGSDYEKDNVPMEASVINGIVNATAELVKRRTAGKAQSKEVDSVVRQLMAISKDPAMFMEIVAQMRQQKDSVQKEIAIAAADVLQGYIEEFIVSENQPTDLNDPNVQGMTHAEKVGLFSTLGSLFQMTPEKFSKIEYVKGITAYNINLKDNNNKVINQLSRGLRDLKQWLNLDPARKSRYLNNVAFLRTEAAMEDMISLLNEEGSPNSADALLVKELLASERFIKFYQYTVGNDNQDAIKEFFFDIFENIELPISKVKNYGVLATLLSRSSISKNIIQSSLPSSKINVNGVNQSALRRPKLIKTIMAALNYFASNRLTTTVVENEEEVRKENRNLWAQLVEAMDPSVKALYKAENQFNPLVQISSIASKIQPANVAAMNAGRDFDLRSPGYYERILTQIGHYVQMMKYGNAMFDMNFFPTNKTDVRGFNVPLYIKDKVGDYVLGGDTILAKNGTGWLVDYFNEILKRIEPNTKLDLVNSHLPEWLKAKKTDAGFVVEYNPSVLQKQAQDYLREYVMTAAVAKTSIIQTKQIATFEEALKIRNQFVNKIVDAAILGQKQLAAEIELLQKSDAVSKVEGLRDFLDSISKDAPFSGDINQSPLNIFEGFVFNQTANQLYVNNTFNPPIDAIVNNAVGKAEGFENFTRISTKDAPGMPINIKTEYAVINIVYPGDKKALTINLGNGETVEFDVFEGHEFVSEEYSSAVTASIGPYNRMAGNLKMTGTGVNDQGVQYMHKSMSVVLTKELAERNPVLLPIYNAMKENGLDKIVTNSATKSAAELAKATNFNISFENGKIKVPETISVTKMTVPENGLVVQLPVNISQSDAISGGSRSNKMDIQMIDQLNALVNSPDNNIQNSVNKMLRSLANAIDSNGQAAEFTVNKLSNIIAELQQIRFTSEIDKELSEQEVAENERNTQKRGQLLQDVLKQISDYEQNLMANTGKEGSAKITRIKNRITQELLNPGNPSFTFENAYQEIHEIINDINRDSQSIWVPGGYHSIVSGFFNGLNLNNDGTATTTKFNENAIDWPVVKVNEETARSLGWRSGQRVLLTKSPFNNMATKLFAQVEIGTMSGSSIEMPVEWIALTGSDGDGDAVRSYTIDPLAEAEYANFLAKYTDPQKYPQIRTGAIEGVLAEVQQQIINNEETTPEEREAMQNDALLKKYYRLKAGAHAQEFLKEFSTLHTNNNSVKNTQFQRVSVAKWDQAAEELGFKEQSRVKNIYNAVQQAVRTSLVKLTQAGIGIGAASTSTMYKLAGANASLFKNVADKTFELTRGTERYLPGQIKTDSNRLSENGKSMIDPMSDYLQILVDSFKNNYAEKFGINDSNIISALILAQSGLSEKDVLTIINQPIFKLWAEIRKEESLNKVKSTSVSKFSNGGALELEEVRKFLINEINNPDKRVPEKDAAIISLDPEQNEIKANLSKISGKNITNQAQSVDELISVIKRMNADQLVGQIEAFKILAGLAPQSRSLEQFIRIRKKFIEGETNADMITKIISDMEEIGMIAPINSIEDGVKRETFVYNPLSDSEVLAIQKEIEAISDILDRNMPFSINDYATRLQLTNANETSIKEALRYRRRLLAASKVNGNYVKTLYLSDPILQKQINNFFNSIALTSQAVAINQEKIQHATQEAMQGKVPKYRFAEMISKWHNWSKLNITRYSLLRKINPEITGQNNIEKAKFFASFNDVMQTVLERMYEHRAKIANGNAFLENLEFVVDGEKPSVGVDQHGTAIYSEDPYIKSDVGMVPVPKDETATLKTMYADIFTALENNGVIIENYDSVEELIDFIDNALPEDFFDQVGMSKKGVQYLAGLEFYNNPNNGEFGTSIFMYDGIPYDAVSGYGITMVSATYNDFGFPLGDFYFERKAEDLNKSYIENAAEGLANLTMSEDMGEAISTYFNQLNKILDTKNRVSPQYKKEVVNRVNLSQDNRVAELPMDQIRRSLTGDFITDPLYQQLLETATGNEPGESIFDYIFKGLGSNGINERAVLTIYGLLTSGEFNYAVALYQSLNTSNHNVYMAYSSLLDKEINRLVDSAIKSEMENPVVNIESAIFQAPEKTQAVTEADIQNRLATDSEAAKWAEYVHLKTPTGLILFKKVIVNQGGVILDIISGEPIFENAKPKKDAKSKKGAKPKKSPKVVYYYPVMVMEGSEKHYIPSITGGVPIDSLQTLGNIDLSTMNPIKLMELISGIFNVNQGEGQASILKTEKIMEELYALTEIKNDKGPVSIASLIDRFIKSTTAQNKFARLFSNLERNQIVKNLRIISNLVNPKSVDTKNDVTTSSKMFRNLFYGASINDDAVETERAKEDVKTAGIPTKKNILTSLSRIQGWLNRTAILEKQNASLATVLKSENKGVMPKNFKEAMGSLMGGVNSNAFFSGISKLLINKVGTAEVKVMTNDEYINFEQSVNQRSQNTPQGESTSGMIYKDGIIYVNGDMPFDSNYSISDFIHEAVHALTVNLYQTDPGFANELNRISQDFYTACTTNSQAWNRLSPVDKQAIEDRILAYHPSNGGTQEEFALEMIAEVFSNGTGELQRLMMEIPSSAPLPSNMLKNLWNRFMLNLSRALGITSNNINLMSDLVSLLDANYNRLGFNRGLVKRNGPYGNYYKQGARIIKDVRNEVWAGLQTTTKDWMKGVLDHYNSLTGNNLASIEDMLERHLYEKEMIEYLGELVRIKVANPNNRKGAIATNLIQQNISGRSVRFQHFVQHYENKIRNRNFTEINQAVEATDMDIAGKIDALEVLQSGEVNVHMVAPDSFNTDLSEALKEETKGKGKIFDALNNVMVGTDTPTAISMLEAGILAHIKESLGYKVKDVVLTKVGAFGGIEEVSIPWNQLRPNVNAFIKNNLGQGFVSRPEAIMRESEILKVLGVNPLTGDDSFKLTWDGWLQEQLDKLSDPTDPYNYRNPAALERGTQAYYSRLLKGFVQDVQGEKYLNLSFEDLAKLVTVSDALFERGLVNKQVVSYLREIFFAKMNEISEEEVVKEIKKWEGTKSGQKEMFTLGIEGLNRLFNQTYGAGTQLSRGPIGDAMSNMAHEVTKTSMEMASVQEKASTLWHKVLADNGVKKTKAFPKNVALSQAKELQIMKRFGYPKEGLGGVIWYFHPQSFFDSQNPTQAEREYYEFLKTTVENVLKTVAYNRTGSSPFIKGSELTYLMNEYNQAEAIPMPAANIQFRGKLWKTVNILKKLKAYGNAALDKFVQSAEVSVLGELVKSHGAAKVKAINPKTSGSLQEVHTVKEWNRIIDEGLIANPQLSDKYNALREEIKNKVESGEIEVASDKYPVYSKGSIKMNSFVIGRNKKEAEARESYDVQYNFEEFLADASNAMVIDKINAYMMSIDEILSAVLEPNSETKETLLGILRDKYMPSSEKNDKDQENPGTKTVRKALNAARAGAVFYYLGWNIRAQLIDLFGDSLIKMSDDFSFKNLRGLFNGYRYLFFNNDSEKENFAAMWDSILGFASGKNRMIAERLMTMENVFSKDGKYQNKVDAYIDGLVEKGYGLYKIAAYTRLSMFAFAHMEPSEAKTIMQKLKSGNKLTAEEQKSVQYGLDRFVALNGPFIDANSIPEGKRQWLTKNLLVFKHWMVPAMVNKWGTVGNQYGDYRHFPVYSTLGAMIKSAWDGNTPSSRAVEAVRSMTPEEKQRYAASLTANLLLFAANFINMYLSYWSDDEDKAWYEEIYADTKKANEMADTRYQIQTMMMVSQLLGASPMALISGIMGVEFVETLFTEIIKPAPKNGKYINKKMVEKYGEFGAKMHTLLVAKGPIGSILSTIHGDRAYMWTPKYQEDRLRYFAELEKNRNKK